MQDLSVRNMCGVERCGIVTASQQTKQVMCVELQEIAQEGERSHRTQNTDWQEIAQEKQIFGDILQGDLCVCAI